MSTNKVYGDGPNHLRLVEQETRWDYDDEQYREWHTRNLFHRSMQALFIRGIQGCCGTLWSKNMDATSICQLAAFVAVALPDHLIPESSYTGF